LPDQSFGRQSAFAPVSATRTTTWFVLFYPGGDVGLARRLEFHPQRAAARRAAQMLNAAVVAGPQRDSVAAAQQAPFDEPSHWATVSNPQSASATCEFENPLTRS